MAEPRILVVGGGAIGGVTAGLLTRAGVDTTVLDADEVHVTRLREPGLLLDRLGEPLRIPLQAYTTAGELPGRYDYALITLKSLPLAAALGPLVDRGIAETYVSLGNGLVQEVVADLVGRANTLAGVVEWGSTNLGPGHLAQTTEAPFVVGELDGGTSPRAERIAKVLALAAPGTAVSTELPAVIWTKLLLNSTFSGLGAVAGMLYREVAADPLGRRLAYQVWTEGYRVGIAQGLRLREIFGIEAADLVLPAAGEPTAANEGALERLIGQSGPTKASMWQDLERGLRTEVDVINGGVARVGRQLGVPTPLNDEIVRILHDYEDSGEQPNRSGLLRLAAETEHINPESMERTS